MSAAEALENPIYIVSLDPELSACVVCPGKLLKNTQMANAHFTSNVNLPCSKRCYLTSH